MRTTIDLAPELLAAAKKIASARSQSLGTVISELALQALYARTDKPLSTRSGFPVFKVRKGAAPISLEDVKRDEDDE
jgi:hypothetical protein